MVKSFFLAIVVLIVLLATYLYFYLGVNQPVRVTLEKLGPFDFLYKVHTGPYHQIGSTIDDVEKWVSSQNLRCLHTFGEFLDNPESIDEDRLRSHVGCVLATPIGKIPADMVLEHRGEHSYAVGHFDGSPAIGPYKVYPRIRSFLESKRATSSAPILEFYTRNGGEGREAVMETQYLFSVD